MPDGLYSGAITSGQSGVSVGHAVCPQPEPRITDGHLISATLDNPETGTPVDLRENRYDPANDNPTSRPIHTPSGKIDPDNKRQQGNQATCLANPRQTATRRVTNSSKFMQR